MNGAPLHIAHTQAERDAKLGGDIAVAYFAVGGPCAVFLGHLADRVQNRVRLYTLVPHICLQVLLKKSSVIKWYTI